MTFTTYAMANLRPEDTGLPMVVWISEKGGAKHGPRLKVSKKMGDKIDPSNVLTVTVSDNPTMYNGELEPKVFNKLKQFIKLNKENLLKYWNNEVSTREFLNSLIKIS